MTENIFKNNSLFLRIKNRRQFFLKIVHKQNLIKNLRYNINSYFSLKKWVIIFYILNMKNVVLVSAAVEEKLLDPPIQLPAHVKLE